MSQQTVVAPNNAQVNKIWRKVQGPVSEALNFECEEWAGLEKLEEEGLAWSLREVTFPLDITEGGRLSQIPEGGSETLPYTPNAEEVTLTPVFYNTRFAASKWAMYVDQNGGDAMIENELKWRGTASVRTMARGISDDFYGFGTSILALTNSDISGTTVQLTLISGYGVTGITNTTFICDKFRISDRIAILSAGTYQQTGTVTTITASTGVIAVVLDAALTITTDGLQIVRANAVESTQTSYNRGLTGMLDGATSSAIQGLDKTSIANWSVSYSDTTTSRFTGTMMHIAKDSVKNYGGGKVDVCEIDQAVFRDLSLQAESALRQMDPYNLVIDGAAKSKGVEWRATRRVPPGYVFPRNSSGLRKWQLNPKPGSAFSWRDGLERPDDSFLTFSADFPIQLAWKNRKKLTYFSGKQGQS